MSQTKSVAPQPQNPRPIKAHFTVPFEANGETYIATINRDAYTTRLMREYNRTINAIEKLPADEQDDAYTDEAIKLALLGTVSCSAFDELTLECLLDSNYLLTSHFAKSVTDAVLNRSPTLAADS